MSGAHDPYYGRLLWIFYGISITNYYIKYDILSTLELGRKFTLQMSKTAALCGTAADSDMLHLAMGAR